ncbi:bifunctional metallophosphatase/5'-nucleotidase [Lederbergia wuyishanensis]|uniref:2',3'-cyclic-nucleotide 2'-phosphodiesterase (5'-nucleotidase family) n=1 Tax=Lederbergia wuyishanensis TaxID=1347903 RepID=A0ABU0D955_9BACI|nr:bifunctional UDP-sugar hydrolase/5'-nucleotidase [Lederbergia wuyishanensis]MCJ8009434.1 bifunctional metallophosphatase/5'-nucleotidase [Lederbergia wuyishanensis]MDQ0344956.1 2',3'-cyclic-nucleotide 2'-phosphodiesterase (5'-nucleotidase family) [Lederbergia wuyishanensis]
MKEKVHIYHTNDLHSHFENWPKIQSFLAERKSFHEAAGEDVFIFDCGDFMDRWHPFTEGSMGKGNTKLLNESQYNAVTIGNNEGITLPFEDLDSLYKEANFEVIVANLYLPEYKRPEWVRPYIIYETIHGHKIGVTAVTTYYQKLYKLLGWELSEPFTELEMQLNRMKDEVDMIIVLSHLGIHDDEKMVELFPQIDLILGAHTHHFFHEGKKIHNTMMAAAGKYGRFVGYVEVELMSEPTIIQPTLFETAFLPSKTDEESFERELETIGKRQLAKKVAHLHNTLEFSWNGPSTLANLLCEALHEWCNPDCTLINTGLVLTSLRKGNVTKYDIHQMLPHPINPCTVELTGAELKEVLLHAEDGDWVDLEVIGLGFRGSVMGAFIHYGVEVEKNNRQVLIKGTPIEPEKTYTLATTDMFTFGRFFPEIRRSEVKNYFMPEFLRDIMEWKLKRLND